jgi:hypothetical protein
MMNIIVIATLFNHISAVFFNTNKTAKENSWRFFGAWRSVSPGKAHETGVKTAVAGGRKRTKGNGLFCAAGPGHLDGDYNVSR